MQLSIYKLPEKPDDVTIIQFYIIILNKNKWYIFSILSILLYNKKTKMTWLVNL